MAAARGLSAAGLKVILLEARDRIDWRIDTHLDDDPAWPVESCAEIIHGGSCLARGRRDTQTLQRSQMES